MSRKEKMKVYHGIPKSVTDENTIFYTDFDGKLNELNGANCIFKSYYSFKPSISGVGLYLDTTSSSSNDNYYILNKSIVDTDFTIDFNLQLLFNPGTSSIYRGILSLLQDNNVPSIAMRYLDAYKKLRIHFYNILEDSTRSVDISIDKNVYTSIRVTFNRKTGICIYVNGVLVSTLDVYELRPIARLCIGKYTNTAHAGAGASIFNISDLHISNIDRGDYFPNLPQDFIEGKAIIKERLGQQQIKGDPLISQTTELLINAQDPSKWLSSNDGYVTSIVNPEVSINDGGFPSGSKIKIKALNNEIISGVIDADTALCRVYSSTGNTLFVDDVSKLVVGDIITAWKPSTGNHDTSIRTITEVDTINKSITFTGPSWSQDAVLEGWTAVLERTPSSSVPIVKTVDGTVVNGTWTGLGNKEAIFTLGTNTGLQGKDLIVTYSLNIAPGNSHFPELPSDIERAYTETGIEMKPVNELYIVDDFKRKKRESIIECPHIARYTSGVVIKTPSQFSAECSESVINNLYNNDGSCVSVKATDGIPQLLFSFNIIEMVERKIGTIPSGDKVQWLKDNLDSNGYFNVYGYGTGNAGNSLTTVLFDVTTNEWYGHYSTNASTSSLVQIPFATLTERRIDKDGFIHGVAYSSTGNTSEPAYVYIDYVSLKIKLKTQPNFIHLYCDNINSRENKCNPVLIQKETKTVKRYIPSKECFVTESNYLKVPFNTTDKHIIRKVGNLYYNVGNSSQLLTLTNDATYYSNILEKTMANDSRTLYANRFNLGKLVPKLSIPCSDDTGNYPFKVSPILGYRQTNSGFTRLIEGVTVPNNVGVVGIDVSEQIPSYQAIVPLLTELNSELKLVLLTTIVNNTTKGISFWANKSSGTTIIDLPNRPLIK